MESFVQYLQPQQIIPGGVSHTERKKDQKQMHQGAELGEVTSLPLTELWADKVAVSLKTLTLLFVHRVLKFLVSAYGGQCSL